MASRYLLILLASIGIVLGVVAIFMTLRAPPVPAIPFPPPSSPYEHAVAGEGLVEAASEDIYIGTPFSEIVEKVFVAGGDLVGKGDPLFRLNSSILQAQLEEAKAALLVAEAEYQKQLDLPRPEDVPPQETLVKQAETTLLDREKQFEIVDFIDNPKAVSRDQYNQRKYGAILAKYQLEEAQERLNLLLAGAWIRDLDISKAQVREAKKRVETLETEIDRYTVCAPFDGKVFRVSIRVGELAQATAALTDPLMIFGSIEPYNIRVDIDEEDAWRVIEGAPGIAFMRGNRNINAPLKFKKILPYLVPKLSLTGENTERVDTRVLQIIYELDREEFPIFPGMLMDVFLEAKPTAGAE